MDGRIRRNTVEGIPTALTRRERPMPERYRSLDEKPFDSHYMWEEIDIDAPVETVFGFALRIGDWMDAHILESVDGVAGHVGHFERVFPRELPSGTGHPHHHVYGIAHIIPNRYIALEVMPERGGSYGETRPWTSFDGITLTDLGDAGTRVVFLLIDSHEGRGTDDSRAERATFIEGMRTQLIVPYLHRLKEQVESHVTQTS
jgi:hypothetical protein